MNTTKKTPTWLLVFGYVFVIVGGLIGIGIGAYIGFGEIKTADGTKIKRYNDASRKQGKIILMIGLISTVIFNVSRFM